MRDTEEEALSVWKEIVGKADTEAVEGFRAEVKQAGASSKDGKGMWADSSIEDLVQYNDGTSFTPPSCAQTSDLCLTRFKSKLIGTPRQVADRILLFKSLGVSFLLTAFLHFQEGSFSTLVFSFAQLIPRAETEQFGKQVLPLVREGELAGRGIDAEAEIAISGHIYS